MRIAAVILVLAFGAIAGGCAGVRTSGNAYVAHGESFHFFGLKIPDDELTPDNLDSVDCICRFLARKQLQPV